MDPSPAVKGHLGTELCTSSLSRKRRTGGMRCQQECGRCTRQLQWRRSFTVDVNPHLQPWALGSDRKNEVEDSFPHQVSGVRLRDRVRSSDFWKDILKGCFLGSYHSRSKGHAQPGGDPELAGGTTYPIRPEKTSGSNRKRWNVGVGRGMCGIRRWTD